MPVINLVARPSKLGFTVGGTLVVFISLICRITTKAVTLQPYFLILAALCTSNDKPITNMLQLRTEGRDPYASGINSKTSRALPPHCLVSTQRLK